MSRSNRKKDCEVQEGARQSIVPAGAPDWITAELIDATIRTWQPFYKDVLTADEAVTMLVDVGRLFDVLSSRS